METKNRYAVFYDVIILFLLLIIVVQNASTMYLNSFQKRNLDAAMLDCMEFEATSFVIVDGEIYCGATFQGMSMLLPLKELQERTQE